ncbi:MAG TPA: multidrug effflux MFS transporter [Myxococcales bacterium]|jgi:DHA1 family bicyclomycin/chloramphenicol resistance-like MFS transporter
MKRSDGQLAYLLAAISSVGPFCIDAYLPSMPELSQVFGRPLPVVQQTLTAYMAMFAIMTLWHGAISDAVGRRRVILVSMALFALASVGCALAPSFEALLFFRALQGMTAGTGMVVGRAIVRDLHQGPQAQKMLSLVTLVFAVAPSVAPVIGGWLQHFFGWRSVFFFMAAFAVAVFVWAYLTLPESLPREQRQPFAPGYLLRTYFRALTHVRFMAAVFGLALGFSGFFVYVLSAPVFLMTHLHLHETEFLWLFGPITAGMLIGAWGSGRLAGEISTGRTVVLGFATMGLAVAINLVVTLALEPGVPWSVASMFFYALGFSLATPSLTLMALDLFPQQRGLAASCQSFVQSMGNAANAAFFAPLLWATPLRLSLGSAAFFALAGIAVALHLLTGTPDPAA